MNKVQCLASSSEHFLFFRQGRLFSFLAEPAILLELDPQTCLDGEEPKSELLAALSQLTKQLANEEGTSRKLLRKACQEFVPKVSALNLNLTDKCNLACVYCYAKGGDYERITDDLSCETIVETLEAAREVIDNSRQFRFEFFGGEPLLNRETIEKVLQWEKSQDIHDKPIINRVSTSLSFLTPELEEALHSGNFILSVSLDGTRETQNAQRPYKSGGGTYDEIIKNVTTMKERAPHLVTVARMTAYENAGRLCQEIEELRALNIFDYCSVYSAAIEDDEGGKLYMSEEYRASYLEFASRYDHYLGDETNIFKGCLELNRYLGHILLGSAALNHCRAGIGYYALSPDGSVHPCHRIIGREDLAIKGGLKNIENTPEYWRVPVLDRDGCKECNIRYFCGGGCKQENLISTGEPLGRSEKNCQFSNLLFEAALIAATSLSEKSRKRLEGICRGLSDLFVLCGQNVDYTARDTLKEVVEASLSEFLIGGK